MSAASVDTPAAPRRCIWPVHAIAGRARFRLSWLHTARQPGEAERIADDLARLPGIREVLVNPFTGSLVCLFDPDRLDVSAILIELGRMTGGEVVERGRSESVPRAAQRRDGPGEVARQVTQVFKDLDDEILGATNGKLDLGTAATFAFVGAGALSVAFGNKLSSPPWFNLAWWGLRTFMLFEADAVAEPSSDRGDSTER